MHLTHFCYPDLYVISSGTGCLPANNFSLLVRATEILLFLIFTGGEQVIMHIGWYRNVQQTYQIIWRRRDWRQKQKPTM